MGHEFVTSCSADLSATASLSSIELSLAVGAELGERHCPDAREIDLALAFRADSIRVGVEPLERRMDL